MQETIFRAVGKKKTLCILEANLKYKFNDVQEKMLLMLPHDKITSWWQHFKDDILWLIFSLLLTFNPKGKRP